MRKILMRCVILLLILNCSLSFTGCSSKPDISKEALALTKNAISATDNFLDGSHDALTAMRLLGSYRDNLDKEVAGNATTLLSIKSSITNISLAVSLVDDGSKQKDELIEMRNNLAEKIGVKKYK